jgi:hypothetical protein
MLIIIRGACFGYSAAQTLFGAQGAAEHTDRRGRGLQSISLTTPTPRSPGPAAQASALPSTITVKCTNILGMVSTNPFDPGAYIELVNSGVVNGTSAHSLVSSTDGPVSAGPDSERVGRWNFFESP